MYQATQDIKSRVKSKNPRIYCRKGDLLFPLLETYPIIVVTKREIFSVLNDQIKKVEMTPQKLLKAVKEVSENPQINDKKFPYDFVTGISNGKEWEQEFLKQLKLSDVEKTIKEKLLEKYGITN